MDDEVPRFYANWCSPVANVYDLELRFGHLAGDSEDVRWSCSVSMSWEEALTVREMLDSQIARYEEHVGTIRKYTGPPLEFDVDDVSGRSDDEEEEDNG